MVAMESGKFPMLIVSGFVAAVIPSATRMVNLNVPLVSDLPEITPVPASSDSPAGSEPAAIDQV